MLHNKWFFVLFQNNNDNIVFSLIAGQLKEIMDNTDEHMKNLLQTIVQQLTNGLENFLRWP